MPAARHRASQNRGTSRKAGISASASAAAIQARAVRGRAASAGAAGARTPNAAAASSTDGGAGWFRVDEPRRFGAGAARSSSAPSAGHASSSPSRSCRCSLRCSCVPAQSTQAGASQTSCVDRGKRAWTSRQSASSRSGFGLHRGLSRPWGHRIFALQSTSWPLSTPAVVVGTSIFLSSARNCFATTRVPVAATDAADAWSRARSARRRSYSAVAFARSPASAAAQVRQKPLCALNGVSMLGGSSPKRSAIT